mmetsp:Transcript_12200/g.35317  ORF Transcript_12200/g.35317 Transcript_12200/m.35317 type:complete len:206 (+) Transcript_12200:934-1551(+)
MAASPLPPPELPCWPPASAAAASCDASLLNSKWVTTNWLKKSHTCSMRNGLSEFCSTNMAWWMTASCAMWLATQRKSRLLRTMRRCVYILKTSLSVGASSLGSSRKVTSSSSLTDEWFDRNSSTTRRCVNRFAAIPIQISVILPGFLVRCTTRQMSSRHFLDARKTATSSLAARSHTSQHCCSRCGEMSSSLTPVAAPCVWPGDW